MSNKNIIARTAAAIADMEVALEATRQEHARVSTARIEAKLDAFAEVIRNTRRKMDSPAGFDWALHSSFKVVAITDTYLKVEAAKPRYSERVLLDVPRDDLSLSTWQVTGIIRRLSAERLLDGLNTEVTAKQEAASEVRKEVQAAQERLTQSEDALDEARDAVARRLERVRVIEAKREAARARRKTPAPEAVAPEAVAPEAVAV